MHFAELPGTFCTVKYSILLQQKTHSVFSGAWGYAIKVKMGVNWFPLKKRYFSVKISENQKWWALGSAHTTHICDARELSMKMLWNTLIGVVICQVWSIKCRTHRWGRIDSYDKISNVIKFSASQDMIRTSTRKTWDCVREAAKKEQDSMRLQREHIFFPKWDIYISQKMTSLTLWLMASIQTSDELKQMMN